MLLFTFDTTRADFLGCYGKEDAQTPFLDALAAEGFLFEYAIASNPVTQAAHSTILTGVWPMRHGVRDNMLFHLPEERTTLAEILKEQGYATGAAVGGFPLVASFGAAQGFDFYDDDLTAARLDHRGRPVRRDRPTWYDERPAGHVNDAILPWIREHVRDDPERPFFAWLHYWDPHEPHIAPAPYDQVFAHDPYQGEIAYADRSLGALLEALDEIGELDRTLIVMTSDHGESRMDHGEATHAFLAYGSTLHVPLIVRLGESETNATVGRRIAERVGTVDIVPTILDLLNLDVPAAVQESLQGRSLKTLMLDPQGSDENRTTYYSESLSPRLSHGVGELRALYRGPYKYIHGPRPELYNLDDDPNEIRDLSAELPEQTQRFEKALQEFLDAHASDDAGAAVHEVDPETRRKLEALGYLSASGDDEVAVSETLTTEGAAPQDRVGDVNLAARLRQEVGAGLFHLAKITAEELLDRDPDNAYYQGRLAAALVGLDRIDEAARLVEETKSVGGANQAEFLAVARALFETDEERGLSMAKRLVEAGETAASRLMLANMQARRGEKDLAAEELRQAATLDPQNRDVRRRQAQFHVEAEENDEAETIYRALLSDFPADAASRFDYARLLREQERAADALPLVERVLRLAPEFCDAHREHVAVLDALQRFEEARAAEAAAPLHCRTQEATENEPAPVAVPEASVAEQTTSPTEETHAASWRTGEQTVRLSMATLEERIPKQQTTACRELRRSGGEGDLEALLPCYREAAEALALEDSVLAQTADADRLIDERLAELLPPALLAAFRRLLLEDLGEPTEEQIAARYASRKDEYRRPGSLTLRNLFLRHEDPEDPESTLELLRELKRRAETGENFGRLAREYSHSETAQRDGMVGKIREGDLPASLEAVAFALPDGGISEPIRVRGGAILLEVRRSSQGRQMPLDDVRKMIRSQLIGEEIERRLLEHAAAVEPSAEAPESEKLDEDRLYRALLASEELNITELRSEVDRRLRPEAIAEIVDLRMREEMDAALSEEELQAHYDDNRALFQSPLRFDLQVWDVPFDDDPALQAARLEEMRERLVADEIRLPEAVEEIGGTVSDLGLVSLEELPEAFPPKTEILLLQIPAEGGYSAVYQQDDALHVLHLRGREEPRTLTYEEAEEQVRERYLERFERRLYDEVVRKRLHAISFEFFEEIVRRSDF